MSPSLSTHCLHSLHTWPGMLVTIVRLVRFRQASAAETSSWSATPREFVTPFGPLSVELLVVELRETPCSGPETARRDDVPADVFDRWRTLPTLKNRLWPPLENTVPERLGC